MNDNIISQVFYKYIYTEPVYPIGFVSEINSNIDNVQQKAIQEKSSSVTSTDNIQETNKQEVKKSISIPKLQTSSQSHTSSNINKIQKELLVFYPENTLTEIDKTLLSNILKAVNVTLEEVEMYQYTDENIKLAMKTFEFNKVLSFGAKLRGMEVDNYLPQKKGNFILMLADPLGDFHQSKDLKMKLWNALKQMFQI